METKLIEKQIADNEVLSAEATKQLLADLGAKESLLNNYAKKAEAAANAAEAALSIANQAKKDADSAKNVATGELKVGVFNKREAILDVKGRVAEVAKALTKATTSQIDLAKAQTELARAQKVSLECQKKLAEISVAMVQLGCISIANSRIVVRQLEARLEGASEEELNDLARAELRNVVAQIRDQQDVLAQQEQLSRIVYGQEERLRENIRADSERDRAIMEQMRLGLERDGKIAAQARRSEEHHKVLVMQNKRNEEISRTLKQHEKISEAIQKNVSLNASRMQTHSQLLEQNVKVVKALDERILINADMLQKHTGQLIDHSKKLSEQFAVLERNKERLDLIEPVIELHSSRIQRAEDGIGEVSTTVSVIIQENAQRDSTLENYCERIVALENENKQKEEVIKDLTGEIAVLREQLHKKASKIAMYLCGGAGVAGLVISILQFFV